MVKLRFLVPAMLLAGFAIAGQAQEGGQGDAAPPPVAPAELFKQRCQMCHMAVPAQPMPLGPDLTGIIGRKAATGSFKYSAALQKAGLKWTREMLDTFLAAPGKVVPGTNMAVSVPDAKDRAVLIEYLSTLK